jgi:hypothetical protein
MEEPEGESRIGERQIRTMAIFRSQFNVGQRLPTMREQIPPFPRKCWAAAPRATRPSNRRNGLLELRT